MDETSQKKLLETYSNMRTCVVRAKGHLEEIEKEAREILAMVQKHCEHNYERDYSDWEPCGSVAKVCTKCQDWYR